MAYQIQFDSLSLEWCMTDEWLTNTLNGLKDFFNEPEYDQ